MVSPYTVSVFSCVLPSQICCRLGGWPNYLLGGSWNGCSYWLLDAFATALLVSQPWQGKSLSSSWFMSMVFVLAKGTKLGTWVMSKHGSLKHDPFTSIQASLYKWFTHLCTHVRIITWFPCVYKKFSPYWVISELTNYHVESGWMYR